MTQAVTISTLLKEDGHTVQEIIVGNTRNRVIPQFFFKSAGATVSSYITPEFAYLKDGKRVSIFKTILKNFSLPRIYSVLQSVKYIKGKVEEHRPDIVINLYEPLFGLYLLIYKPKNKIISIAHQFMIFAKGSPYGKGVKGKLLLKILSALCKSRSSVTLAISAYPWMNNEKCNIKIIPPLLRKEVMSLNPYDGGYLLCYILNRGFAADLISWHNSNKSIKIHAFWDNYDVPDELIYNENLVFHHIDDIKFLRYFEGCSGFITTSGFESICEAGYLGKPVLMTPVHIEQKINAKEFEYLNLGIVSNEINPSLLLDFIQKEKGKNDNFIFRNRINSSERVFMDSIYSLI